MSVIQAIILGIVQGLTEFFPISSSAHLKLVKHLLGISDHSNEVFNLFCHFGTLSALLWFMRKELFKLFTIEKNKIMHHFLALLPLIPGYFLLKPLREFATTPEFLGGFLFLTGIILVIGNHLRLSFAKKSHIRDVLCIGIVQSMALIPGISRSASTISCAKVLGWNSLDSVNFSFLLSIPTILGGIGLEILRQFFSSSTHPVEYFYCLIGFFAAFFSGALVINFAMSVLKKGHLKPFAWYCIALGCMVAIFL